MSYQRHKYVSRQNQEQDVDDDDASIDDDGDDDSTPTSSLSSGDSDDYSRTRYATSKSKSVFGKNVIIIQKLTETRDSNDEELVRLLDPLDDPYEENGNMPYCPKPLFICERKLMEKITEKKCVMDDKYDADVDTQTSNEGDNKLSKSVPAKMTPRKPSHRTEKRTSQWEELMRKFSEAHKEECKTISLDIPRAPRSVKHFPTGSQYDGSWDILGMSGFGTYTFPNGVLYVGEFDDGMFHGYGELRYPDGAILRGSWTKGHMTERTLLFADGLKYSEKDWKYCRMPDRRFTIEYKKGLQPAGETYLTAKQPTREIPPGHYDTGDGFYDPITKTVYSADDITAIVRHPCPREQKWIEDNCRTYLDETQGPRPDLYEEWSEPQTNPEPPPPPSTISRLHLKSTSTADGHKVFIPEEQQCKTCPDELNSSTSSCAHSCKANLNCN